MRKVPIITSQIYHIFNRGVNKGEIFFAERDYRRFLLAAIHYKIKKSKFSYEKLPLNALNDPGSSALSATPSPRVRILAYCLMPNHFHILAQQLEDEGLRSYLQQLSNSYVHYVNIKYDRVGPLFQGRFKNVLVKSDEQLMHVSRYIHLNPLIADLISNLKDYRWFSYLSYLGKNNDGFCDPKLILDLFPSKEAYEKFVSDHADYARTLERVKHLTFD